MPRGAEAKLRRRARKKEEEEEVTKMFEESAGGAAVEDDDSSSDDDVSQKKSKKQQREEEALLSRPSSKKGIKTLPLVFLIIMTGSTVLPALLFVSDYAVNFAQKNHLLGNIGYRMGLGAVPRQRVVSFYEKHDPTKLPDVPKILSKHYGDYPTLVKKLERKYGDYGYFLGWEEDEAPMKLAFEQLESTREYFVHQYWNRYAPQVLKTAVRNIRYNLTFLLKKGRRVWKKTVWPVLEPFLGVPKGAEKQKRQDAAEARARKAKTSSGGSSGGTTRKRNTDYRDED